MHRNAVKRIRNAVKRPNSGDAFGSLIGTRGNAKMPQSTENQGSLAPRISGLDDREFRETVADLLARLSARQADLEARVDELAGRVGEIPEALEKIWRSDPECSDLE